MRNVLETKDAEKVKIRRLHSITFFKRKSGRLWDRVEKYRWARQATEDNTKRRGKDAICKAGKKDQNTDLCLHNWLIPSDLVKCFTATLNANWETAQRLTCHYDLFSQTVLHMSKEGHGQINFLLFQFSIGHCTWRSAVSTFRFCRRHIS